MNYKGCYILRNFQRIRTAGHKLKCNAPFLHITGILIIILTDIVMRQEKNQGRVLIDYKSIDTELPSNVLLK